MGGEGLTLSFKALQTNTTTDTQLVVYMVLSLYANSWNFPFYELILNASCKKVYIFCYSK